MGRPSKLSEAQWGEVLRRAAQGETVAALAFRFKVDKGTISRRVSQQVQNVKSLAGRIAEDENALEAMPVSQRIATRTLADQLKSIGENVTRAAIASSESAAFLSEAARDRAKEAVLKEKDSAGRKVDPIAAMEADGLQIAANRALSPAMRLIAATMGQPAQTPEDEDEMDCSTLTAEELDQAEHLALKARGELA